MRPVLHFVWCPPDVRRARILARGERRDRPKLDDWHAYASTCRESPPVWTHTFVDGGGGIPADPPGQSELAPLKATVQTDLGEPVIIPAPCSP